MFIHLHTHSFYSFLEGLPSPAQLVQAAVAAGMPALALTDRHFLTGALEFYDACRAAGIKPILGLKLDIEAPPDLDLGAAGPLVLLAQDLRGWTSLCRLSSALLTPQGGTPTGPLPFKHLIEDSMGLICLTGGSRGLLYHYLRYKMVDRARTFISLLAEVFSDNLYIELQRHMPEDQPIFSQLAGLSQELGLPVVATQAVYYLDSAQAELQRTLTAMRLNRPRAELAAEVLALPGSTFYTMEEMAVLFEDLPAAIANSIEISERCQLDLPLGEPQYPAIALPDDKSPNQALREQAYQGAQRRYGDLTSAIRDRLEHELAVIEERGYAVLFLIMAQVLEFTRREDIPTASRGSAASSLVAHCLDITTPDPLKLNLYFERFLNPARHKPPDIDTDLCSRRRDAVIRFVYDTYGADRVAMVCTINRLRARSALREVAKAYGLHPREIKELIAGLPRRGWGPPGRTRDGNRSPYTELAARFRSPHHQAIFHEAAALLGHPRHLSIHPGGLVISPGPMTDLVPTQLASKGIVITQFDLHPIERMGLVKIDLLGIRGLTVIGDVGDAIRKRLPLPHPARLDTLAAIPDDDKTTADLVRRGETIGCFQIESPGMRATLREIQAGNQEDLMVALALYRPGPLTGGLKDAFVRRHLGQEPVTHLHPALAPLLAGTHGVILYQEQVLRIAHELAGLSLAEGDLLRRAMSHFDPGKQLITLRKKFIAGALAKNNVPPETGTRLWDMMAAFAGYGFPKAHAASYAQLAWQAAWCKAHHPAEFMAAVLANWGGYYRQRVYLTEARRLGINVRPPHINFSQREFSVQYVDQQPVLFMGLNQVRDLTRRAQKQILTNQPFPTLNDFLSRVDPRPEEAAHLIQVGALDHLGTIPALLTTLKRSSWRFGQRSLFAPEPVDSEDWALPAKAAAQEKILGVSVDIHPLELVAAQLRGHNIQSSLAVNTLVGQRVRVAGIRHTWRRSMDDSGQPFANLVLEDLEGVLNVLCTGKVYRGGRTVLSARGPLVIEGQVELEETSREVYLRAERVWSLTAG